MMYDLLSKCRTVRRFSQENSPTEQILTHLIECARMTPSAINLQRLRYRLVLGAEADSMFSHIRLGGALPAEHKPTYDDRAPAYIVILTKKDTKEDSNLYIDIGIAAQSISLAARELGFGSCMIKSFSADGVKDIVGNDSYEPMLVIALGTPAEESFVCELAEDGSTRYYKDENGATRVPKRPISELIVPKQ